MNITNEEAAMLIGELMWSEDYLDSYGASSSEPMNVALSMAIEALNKLEKGDKDNANNKEATL